MPEPTKPVRHALMERLIREFSLPELDVASVDAFLAGGGDAVLFFSEDPVQYPESADVAVILPELLAAFPGRLRGAVIARAAERELQKRFGFARWPALVFVRDGDIVGTITGIHDWDDFTRKVAELLAAPTRRELAAQAAQANLAASDAKERA